MQREDVDRLEKTIKELEDSATNAERMCELLQPEFDAFEARTGHNVYVVRDYVDHRNAARKQRQEASAIRALLAERDAAFAAGQEEMRERAAKAADENTFGGGVVASAIRALPIKPRP